MRIKKRDFGILVKLAVAVLMLATIATAQKKPKPTAPVIPASAVQRIDNRQMVFAATDKPNVFALKFVRLRAESNGRFVVLEGLNVGDRIVTDGSFLLRAEWLKMHPGN